LTDVSRVPQSSTVALSLLTLGIVFGDIGTSPLYTLKQTFSPQYNVPIVTENIIGACSAIFWALMIVVSLKYVTLIARADNKGEGGILALLALALGAVRDNRRVAVPIMLLGLVGMSLFFGDAVITPAVSVLAAVEGLQIGTAAFQPYVMPLAVVILFALFAFQRYGTAVVGALFSPICLMWFFALAAVGVYQIAQHPVVLYAINPLHAVHFISAQGFSSFIVLGAVVLAITGAEALYTDIGHFGKNPLRIAWFSVVAPALTLNYFGQGALLIGNPQAVENPFYLAFPNWALYPMVALATLATVIASQAVISGAYSLARQAVQLGYLPRLNVLHTSDKEIGQIYVPAVNWTLLAAVLAAVIGFGSSSALASAYGLAAVGAMLVDTLLTFFVIRYRWQYNLLLCIAATGFFLAVDAAFFSATLFKIVQGGWFPLTIAAIMLTLMLTWRRGREILLTQLRTSSVPLVPFLDSLFLDSPSRIPGTAVFMTSTPDAVPHALLHNLAHNKVLHQRVVFLTVKVEDVPWVPLKERVNVDVLQHNCYRITIHFGFKDQPDVPAALELCREQGLEFNILETSFFLSRETVIPTARSGNRMWLWRERLFATVARNASSAVEYFNLPTNRVIELGTQVEI
jgi:KUP system potassium uptake protein